MSPSPNCVDVNLLEDNAIEGDHSFQLFISSNLSEPEITPGMNSTVTITITDNTGMGPWPITNLHNVNSNNIMQLPLLDLLKPTTV